MQRISECLSSKFPGEGPTATYRAELARICSAFAESGFADGKYVRELTLGPEGTFWSCVSEALIFDRLRSRLAPRISIGSGPDFLLLCGDTKVWVEVVCPEPVGIPQEWLNIQTSTAVTVPHEAILLRWTSVIKDKAEKLIGSADGRTAGYLQTGVVSPNDVYVVAVNGCRLRNGPFPALNGISQFPYAVEAVFPVGPYQIRIDRGTLKAVGQGYQERFNVTKPTGANVPTSAFLDPRYAPVSAIWAVDFNGEGILGNSEPSALVHNPNAVQPLPRDFLDADVEFVASSHGDGEFLLERHSRNG
ncbi:hypothetical protein [Rhizobacter sp. Root404]|uniref:hypothetical protein n=1 Tax=Rhizobacter sp. Root404 TaxID=1736528 RepID=UPI000AD798FB|nr:hypothetical protein [Rhizobacter sp. Root404]